MYKFQKKSLSTALLLLALPMAGCASDNMFADESITPYGGSKMHPIKVVNGRAVVENCGDWSDNRADTEANEMSANHGCAVQANIAAMAAYPSDLAGNVRKRPKRLGWVHQYAIDKVTADPSSSGSSPSPSSTPSP
jgi:type IV pilus biogenesis protein CpaD/CtpE